ncbi:hypothetical protein BBJ29_010071 [Phytophthora kernoviae]|uniref:Acyltransferase 3 domain-containing protein n=1 Tax=Phytophthora kernoviae TaxID=325452 RepID=A0A3R7K412_9STRA|nr:hypothetical protein BBJ29_010071 [Phytophthora kernoviae]
MMEQLKEQSKKATSRRARLFCPEAYHRAIHRNSIILIGIISITNITNIVKNPPVFDEHSSYTLADYFSKRFFRVYLLFALLSITLWLIPFEYKHQLYKVNKPEDFNLFLTLTFHPEHRHYLMWTLPLEISYYFVLPAFVLSVLKTDRFWWMAFIPLYVWFIRKGLYTTRDNYHRQPLTKHLPTFIAGSMAAVIFVKLETWMKNTGFNLPPATHYIMPFTSVKLSLLIVIEMVHPSTVSLIFEWIVLRYLGKISFSVYLLHVFVIYIEPIEEQANYYDRTISEFDLVILLATASYHLVEYPSQLVAQRLSRVFTRLALYDHYRLVNLETKDEEEGSSTSDSDDTNDDELCQSPSDSLPMLMSKS